ncbi:MAG: tRNA (adenosine(37)-N6)-dimethylallyltransferase MiaA [Flavobacteriaceae bacterium]
MSRQVLVSVVGPTAIGKTKLAIALAKHFRTEIISADSRQFYKEMNIGTAVPSKEELSAVPHHFIQHISIKDNYSVGAFERDAIKTLEQLFKKHKVVIMVGGSGLYVNAVTEGLDHFPAVDPQIREQLNSTLKEKGLSALQSRLKQLDPDYYKQIDLDNPHRLIRALEVSISSGLPYSSFLNKRKVRRPFKVITIGLTAEREIIYSRINKRVDLMMQQGLLEEVKALRAYQELNALITVGYKELFKYLKGDWELNFAISEIKKNTRRFAKRQLTWFKKNKDISWIDYKESHSAVIKKVEQLIERL